MVSITYETFKEYKGYGAQIIKEETAKRGEELGYGHIVEAVEEDKEPIKVVKELPVIDEEPKVEDKPKKKAAPKKAKK